MAVANNIVVNCPDRDEILVESVFSPTKLRATGTQYAVFHKYRVPAARYEVGLIFFLPTLNSYGINFQQHKVVVKITIVFLTIANKIIK